MLKRRHGRCDDSLTETTLTPSRAIGETMERLDVLIALRKASESQATGEEKNNKEGGS